LHGRTGSDFGVLRRHLQHATRTPCLLAGKGHKTELQGFFYRVPARGVEASHLHLFKSEPRQPERAVERRQRP
jgi:hypothetical protein